MWLLGESLDVNYVVAARLIGAMAGPARRACMRLGREKLFPASDSRSQSNELGVQAVLAHLETTFCQKRVSKKGEVLTDFIAGTRYHRRRGERMSEWLVRYDEGLSTLADQGVDMSAMGDLAGWFLLMRAGLTAERRERVIASLEDDRYDPAVIRPILIRQFQELHIGESRGRTLAAPSFRSRSSTGSTRASSGGSSWRRGGGRSTNIVDDDDDEAYDEDDDGGWQDEDGGLEPIQEEPHQPPEIAQVVRQELEMLENDLQEMGLAEDQDLESFMGAEETMALERAAVELANIPEALATVRDARRRVRGRGRGNRGGRGGGGGGASSASRPATAAGRRGGQQQRGGSARGGRAGGGAQQRPAGKKSKNDPNETCFDCGKPGHWAGDPECPMQRSGGGRRDVQVVEQPIPNIDVERVIPHIPDGPVDAHVRDTCVVGRLTEALQATGDPDMDDPVDDPPPSTRSSAHRRDSSLSSNEAMPGPDEIRRRRVRAAYGNYWVQRPLSRASEFVPQTRLTPSPTPASSSSAAAAAADPGPRDVALEQGREALATVAMQDSCVGILDTACRYSVAGEDWHHDFVAVLRSRGLSHEVTTVPETETYRFGNGTRCDSTYRATVPVDFGGQSRRISYSVLPIPTLSLLLGDDFFEQVGGRIDLENNRYVPREGRACDLSRSQRGHRTLALLSPVDFRPGNPFRWRVPRPAWIQELAEADPLDASNDVATTSIDPLEARQPRPQRPQNGPSRAAVRNRRTGTLQRLLALCATMTCCAPNDALEVAAPVFISSEVGTFVRASEDPERSEPSFAPLPVDDCSEVGTFVRASGAACTPLDVREACIIAGDCGTCGGQATISCGACGGMRCDACSSHGVCVGCRGYSSTADDYASHPEAIQVQDWRNLKGGTRALHRAAERRIATLDSHGVDTRRVREQLEVQAHDEILEVARRGAAHVERPVFIEWCCNERSLISARHQELGGQAVRLGLHNSDLADEKSVAAVCERGLRHLRRGGSLRVVAALPCTDWCTFQRVNIAQYGPAFARRLQRRRLRSRKMVQLFLRTYRTWKRAGGPRVAGAYEWPGRSDGWRRDLNPEIAGVNGTLPLRADFDGCMFGLRHGRHRVRKPWRIQTDHPRLAKALAGRTCDGSHRHVPGLGKIAKATENYTPALARVLVEELTRPLPSSRDVMRLDVRKHGIKDGDLKTARRWRAGVLRTPTSDSARASTAARAPTRASEPSTGPRRWRRGALTPASAPMDLSSQEEQQHEQQAQQPVQATPGTLDGSTPSTGRRPARQQPSNEGEATDAELRVAVQKLHSELGHPENRSLARAIRLAGGSDRAVAAALAIICDVCLRRRQPSPTLKAKLPKTSGPWEAVAIDLFELADYAGQVESFLNIVDLHTGFQLVGLVLSKHPGHIFDEFVRGWCSHYGPPALALMDGGGEFVAEFATELEDLGCELKYTAGISPTQNATCERRGGNWKHVARATIDEHSIRFSDRRRLFWMICAVNWAINSQVNESGYSQSQWALGRGMKLPYSMLSASGRLQFLDRAASESSFADRLALMATAQRAHLALRHSQVLARAWHSRARGDAARPVEHLYAVGDVVYYWRGRGKRKCDWSLRWCGPARVIGFEQNNVWVSHRNRTIKCAAIHLRPASQEERLLSPDAFTKLLEKPGDSTPLDAVPALPEKDEFSPENDEHYPGDKDQYFDMTVDGSIPSHKRRRMTATPDAPTWQPADGPGPGDSAGSGRAYGPVRGDETLSPTKGGDSHGPSLSTPGAPGRPRGRPRSKSPRGGPYDEVGTPQSRRAQTPPRSEPSFAPQRSEPSFAPQPGRSEPSFAPPPEEEPPMPPPSSSPPRRDPDDLRRNLTFLESLVDELGDPQGPRQLDGEPTHDDEAGPQAYDISTPRQTLPPDGPLDDEQQQEQQQEEISPLQLAHAGPQEEQQGHDSDADSERSEARERDASRSRSPVKLRGRSEPPATRRTRDYSSLDDFPAQALAKPTQQAPPRLLRKAYSSLDDFPSQALAVPTQQAPTPSRSAKEAELPHIGESPSKRRAGASSSTGEICLVSTAEGYVFAPYRAYLDVCLVGRARSKEVTWKSLSDEDKAKFRIAMDEEWQRWDDFKAYVRMSAKEYEQARAMSKPPELIGTRWVLTWKPDGKGGFVPKARLVAQGCQEVAKNYRTDSPTASRTGFFLTLLASVQKGWRLESYDARTAFLQAGCISRDLMLKLPKGDQAPRGCTTHESQVVWANTAVYGTRDAGRGWYLYLRKVLNEFGFVESVLERGLYMMKDGESTLAVLHTHVDDFLLARCDTNAAATRRLDSVIESLVKRIYLKRCDASSFTHCGKRITVDESGITISQASTAADIDDMHIGGGIGHKRTSEAALTTSEQTGYYSVLGQLQWLATQSRPDIACDVNLRAQHRSNPTVGDGRRLNKVAGRARDTADTPIVLRRGIIDLTDCEILNFADASFANCQNERSMAGFVVVIGAKGSSDTVWRGHFDRCALVSWASSTIKRVVRSTLGAEAYACSEGTEEAQWTRAIVAELFTPKAALQARRRLPASPARARSSPGAALDKAFDLPRETRKDLGHSTFAPTLATAEIERRSCLIPLISYTDSWNLEQTVDRDSGQSRDKRLRIVVSGLRQLFSRASEEKAFLRWIPTTHQLGDCLTKETSASLDAALLALVSLMAARYHKMPTSEKTVASRSINMLARRPHIRIGSSTTLRGLIVAAVARVADASYELQPTTFDDTPTDVSLLYEPYIAGFSVAHLIFAIILALFMRWCLARIDAAMDHAIGTAVSFLLKVFARLLSIISGTVNTIALSIDGPSAPAQTTSTAAPAATPPRTLPGDGAFVTPPSTPIRHRRESGSRRRASSAPTTPSPPRDSHRDRHGGQTLPPPSTPVRTSEPRHAPIRPWENDWQTPDRLATPHRARVRTTRSVAVQTSHTYKFMWATPRFHPLRAPVADSVTWDDDYVPPRR